MTKKTKNRYKLTFGEKTLTLTTDKDNLFMEEVERLAQEKYQTIKDRLPQADDETVAILMAINTLSLQLTREIAFEETQKELDGLRQQATAPLKEDSRD